MAKTLVIYYSLEGNVDFLARAIAKELDADTFRLETEKEYPKTGLAKYLHGGKDVMFSTEPALKTPVPDLSAYETVIVGAPVWAGKPAAPVNTLFASADFSGKKVGVFASCGGGSTAKTIQLMSQKAKGANVVATESFVNPARNAEAALEKVKAFAARLR